MPGFGQVDIASAGTGYGCCADPLNARWKPGGATIDWSTVTAVSGSDVTLTDGTVVKIGDKYIEVGTTLSMITASRKYGPVATGAADGREVVTNAKRGEVWVIDKTLLKSELGSDHTGSLFDGGIVFRDRLKIGGAGQPTEANFETMFPAITFIDD